MRYVYEPLSIIYILYPDFYENIIYADKMYIKHRTAEPTGSKLYQTPLLNGPNAQEVPQFNKYINASPCITVPTQNSMM